VDINATIIGQAITFAILVFITMKFIWPPLNAVLEERANTIADGLSAAAVAQQTLTQTKLDVAEQIRLARIRAETIVANAEKDASAIIAHATTDAKLAAANIMQQATSHIEAQRLQVQHELQLELANLVNLGVTHTLQSAQLAVGNLAA
jgi:F-type H+-transporting ATPase subunit b